jgi:predicted nuclease of predicted toxin-antitoxin system
MKFLADEGVDKSLVTLLRQSEWDVFYVAESASSLEDELVLELANSESRILITRDKDFGELVYRLQKYIQGSFWLEWRNCLRFHGRKRCLNSSMKIWINWKGILL